MGPVAEAMLERLEDEITLDVGHGATDEGAGYGLGCQRGMRHGPVPRMIEARAVRRHDAVDTNLITNCKKIWWIIYGCSKEGLVFCVSNLILLCKL